MNKSNNIALVITRRELASYFTSPIAYIVTGLFTGASGFLFFGTFFLVNRAELRNFFALLPFMFSFFVPALTMRLLADEKKSGSLETLITLPVTDVDVVLGKFFAAFLSAAALLVPSLFYVITCFIFGSPDAGPLIGGYAGSLLLAASFCAIGLFASSATKNQIIAFFLSFAICIVLTLIGQFSIFLPSQIVNFAAFCSITNHFDSVSRGIIDSRDIIYFLSLTILFLSFTVKSLKATTGRS